jgi:phage terminase large subunit-like protein
VADDRVTAADVIEFIETTCFIPEGKFVGAPLKLFEWQKDELRKIYDNPYGTRRAIISMPRKNAKSTLCACLLLAHLCGPPARNKPNSQLFSLAQSRDQAAIVFTLACKMIRMNPDLRSAVMIQETAKAISCPDLGTRYRALSAESTTAFGLSPSFVIFDELGQVRGPRSALFEALETATGAQESPLTVIISTQAPSDGDLLSMLIDDALAGHDPHTAVSLHTAPIDLDPFAEETIRIANPALDQFMNRAEVLQMAAAAKRMPARQAEFENLVLNRRVEANDPFIARGVWDACNATPASLDGIPVYAGLDLSATTDLTALVCIGYCEDKWHVHPTFWLPEAGLREKATADHVPYDVWHDQGFLETTPGRSISYEYVAHYLRDVFDRYDIVKLGFDRWGMRHLTPWLLLAGFSEPQIEEVFVPFGQGMQSMSPALRELEQILLDGKLAHGGHPVLSSCVANTVVTVDDAGNRKPNKRRSNGRIDGLVALVQAIGVAPLEAETIDVRSLIG